MFDYIKNHISFDYGIVHGVMMDVITVRLRREICYPTDSWTSVWASSQKAVKAAKKKLPSPAVPSHSLILFRPEREHAFGALRKQLVGY